MTLRTESNLEEFVRSRKRISRIPKRQFTPEKQVWQVDITVGVVSSENPH